jgi:hypothetical protein
MRTHPSNEWTDQRNTGLSACDCLTETKQQCQIAVNPVIPFQFPGSLDTLPSGRNLDQNTFFRDPDDLYRAMSSLAFALVAALSKERRASTSVETRPGMMAKISFPNSTSLTSPNGRRNEPNQFYRKGFDTHKAVQCGISLRINVSSFCLGMFDGGIDQSSVTRLLGGRKDQ